MSLRRDAAGRKNLKTMAADNGHGHAHAHTHDALSERGRRRLLLVLWLTAAYMLAEAAGGWWTGSLALLADAGHMLADVAGLGLALLAARFGSRPASQWWCRRATTQRGTRGRRAASCSCGGMSWA